MEPTFLSRLQHAFVYWLSVVGVLTVAGLVVALLLLTARQGGLTAGARRLVTGLVDLVREALGVRPRRLYALAKHSILEAIRRWWALLAFVVFVGVLLFAHWFLSPRPDEQVKIYASALLWIIRFLTVLTVLFLSAMSLPADIRGRTITTVVTKPVRRLELVLGRILGFTTLATLMVVVMGAVGLFYLSRVVDASRHSEQMVAHVPIFGRLTFKDRQGEPAAKGINIGDEWQYRGYVEGGTACSATWDFDHIPTHKFAGRQQVPVFATFGVFRMTKARQKEGTTSFIGVQAQLTFYDGETGERIYDDYPFEVTDYGVNQRSIPAGVFNRKSLRVVAVSLSPRQYIGMAQADLYLLADDAPFAGNFFKGLVGVWFQAIIIASIGAMFSTFLSGPVAVLATFSAFIAGHVVQFVAKLAAGAVYGGGTLEAGLRLLKHENVMAELPATFWIRFIQGVDRGFANVFWALSHVVPDLTAFNHGARAVADGINIPFWQTLPGPEPIPGLVPLALIALGYTLPIVVVGYVFLKTREVAQ